MKCEMIGGQTQFYINFRQDLPDARINENFPFIPHKNLGDVGLGLYMVIASCIAFTGHSIFDVKRGTTIHALYLLFEWSWTILMLFS